jgi:hypothetical protein
MNLSLMAVHDGKDDRENQGTAGKIGPRSSEERKGAEGGHEMTNLNQGAQHVNSSTITF